MHTMVYNYTDTVTALSGFVAYNEHVATPLPAVIVAHDWSGRNEFACGKAVQLAEMGYVGFALDMYGAGRQGNTNEEKSALMQPLLQDRAALCRRVTAAYTAVSQLPQVDMARIAALGFCFGGLCVLDLARSGAEVRGVVSLHGALTAPAVTTQDNSNTRAIVAKILVLHGFADPMVPPGQVMQFAEQMTAAQVDWQIHLYGNTMHAFTNPLANDPAAGMAYDKTADQRAWLTTGDFLREIFKT